MVALVAVPSFICITMATQDSVMYGLLSANQIHDLSSVTEAHLMMFAEDGLRTLCVAETILSRDQYEVGLTAVASFNMRVACLV